MGTDAVLGETVAGVIAGASAPAEASHCRRSGVVARLPGDAVGGAAPESAPPIPYALVVIAVPGLLDQG